MKRSGRTASAFSRRANEYESGQIILSATGEEGRDVRYQVQTEDLKSGSDTLSASNAAIFHEKYIRVSTTSEEAGGYPDGAGTL